MQGFVEVAGTLDRIVNLGGVPRILARYALVSFKRIDFKPNGGPVVLLSTPMKRSAIGKPVRIPVEVEDE